MGVGVGYGRWKEEEKEVGNKKIGKEGPLESRVGNVGPPPPGVSIPSYGPDLLNTTYLPTWVDTG